MLVLSSAVQNVLVTLSTLCFWLRDKRIMPKSMVEKTRNNDRKTFFIRTLRPSEKLHQNLKAKCLLLMRSQGIITQGINIYLVGQKVICIRWRWWSLKLCLLNSCGWLSQGFHSFTRLHVFVHFLRLKRLPALPASSSLIYGLIIHEYDKNVKIDSVSKHMGIKHNQVYSSYYFSHI